MATAEPGERVASGRPREAQPEPGDGLLLHHGVGTSNQPRPKPTASWDWISIIFSLPFYLNHKSVILQESWYSGGYIYFHKEALLKYQCRPMCL